MRRIVIATPYDSYSAAPSRDFHKTQTIGDYRVHHITLVTIGNEPYASIAQARQALVETARTLDAEKMIFIDSDILASEADFETLANAPELVAFAPCPHRYGWPDKTPTPSVPKTKKIQRQGPLCLCAINMSVFDKLVYPFFSERGKPSTGPGEDFVFFRRLYDAKIDPYVYPSLSIAHQDRETGEIYTFNKTKNRILKDGE
jgi:hypothetical protein